VLRAPELDAGLPEGSQQSRTEGQNPLPTSTCAHAAGIAAQGTASFLGCQSTLLSRVELLFLMFFILKSNEQGKEALCSPQTLFNLE